MFGLSFLCPVLSKNLYTATTGLFSAGGKFSSSIYDGSLTTSGSLTQI